MTDPLRIEAALSVLTMIERLNLALEIGDMPPALASAIVDQTPPTDLRSITDPGELLATARTVGRAAFRQLQESWLLLLET